MDGNLMKLLELVEQDKVLFQLFRQCPYDKIVISILHDMDFVAETFKRAVVFAKGNVLLDGDTRTVFAEKDILEQAYLEQPGATRLCHELGYSQVFLSPEEFVSFKKNEQ